MSHTKEVKDYYAILGVVPEASEAEISQAYNKLAVENHPKKKRQHGLSADKKFKDVCEAYGVLGNKGKKAHYDHLIKVQFSLQQAQETFEHFYNQFGVENEQEKQFFEENYPHVVKNFYHNLGVSRHASLGEIQQAYRKLALKYHPKKNPDNWEAKKKFVQASQAYNALSCEGKRGNYNDVAFKSLQPFKAHDIFEEFFTDKPFRNTEDQSFFRPMLEKRWIRSLDKLMDQDLHQPTHQNSETRRVHEVFSSNNGVESRKIVREQKKIVDGKVQHQTTEEYTLPNGEKEVIKTISQGGKVDRKVYHLKKDEDIPKVIQLEDVNTNGVESGNA